MPPWVASLGQLLIGISFFLFGLGFVTIVWKVAWATRGWVDAEKQRAQLNQELVAMVREFIQTQREANDEQRKTNEQLALGIRTVASRLRTLEEDKLVNS